jgi:hypothetical protein
MTVKEREQRRMKDKEKQWKRAGKKERKEGMQEEGIK